MDGDNSSLTSGSQVSMEQSTTQNTATLNEQQAAGSNQFASFPKQIHTDKQGKHIPGHKNYQPGKSRLTISMSEAQRLVSAYSGKGTPIGPNKERVDFGRVIGEFVDPKTGDSRDTTVGIIHYSQSGTHIVPAMPREKGR